MAQCVAAKADGTQCVMQARKKFDGTPAEGLCGRHHHLWATGQQVLRAGTGVALAPPAATTS